MKKIFLIASLFVFGFALGAMAQGTSKVLPVATHYEGGQEVLLADIQKMLQYPPMAKRNRIEGECIIAFTLEKDGQVSNYKVIKNIGGGCGDEAMRVAKALKFNAPGYRVDLTVPVKFTLSRPAK
ncbi:MAG: energy transducer TonB [Bacteroidota bacterium]